MEELKEYEIEAVLNFKAITEVNDTSVAVKYLSKSNWDVTVIYMNSIESSREISNKE
jgi:hypothetical protein